MNLLPNNKKEEIRKERKRRLIVVFGFFLFNLLIIAIVLLLPSFFLLVFQQGHLSDQLATVKENSALKKAKDIEQAMQDINKKIRILQSSKEDILAVSPLINDIVKAKPNGLGIDTFIFEDGLKKDENGQISLQGEAKDRTILLTFIKELEVNDNFSEVISPISNLLKEKDFNFSLILKISPN